MYKILVIFVFFVAVDSMRLVDTNDPRCCSNNPCCSKESSCYSIRNCTNCIRDCTIAIFEYDPDEKRPEKCLTQYGGGKFVCGSDGKNYYHDKIRCILKSEYGKRVNLQQSHKGRCWVWERHGLTTSTLCIVSIPIPSVDFSTSKDYIY